MKYGLDLWKENGLNPIMKEFTNVHNEFDRWMDTFLAKTRTGKDMFNPSCDLEETDANYLLKFDVPGMSKDNIKVELLNNQLVVSGERKEEATKETKYRHIEERYHGKFQRIFALPANSAIDKVEADYKDGVLRIAIPKTEIAKPRQIKVGERSAVEGQKSSTRVNVA
jgi:HSP20 family protein